MGDQAARVIVDTTVPAVALIRNVYDRGWHARLDGRAVPLLRADYILQGVAVPAGRHVIALSYDEPWIRNGLAANALVLAALASLMVVWRRREAEPAG
jgi:uncharacterized membrane protein YfhO